MDKHFLPKDIEDLFGSLSEKPKPPKCRVCHQDMKPASRTDGYNWQCACIPGLVLSKG